MSHFCLLTDPEGYVPVDGKLFADQAARKYLLEHFREQFAETLTHAAEQYGKGAGVQIEAASVEFNAALEELSTGKAGDDGLNVVELNALRGRVLRAHKLYDPYADVKARANAEAAEIYPHVVRKLHAMEDDAKWLHLVKCIFAGNVFDAGADATMHMTDDLPDFFTLVEQTRQRPWLVDDYDRLAPHLLSPPPLKWGKSVLFVDNAGADFILGLMPLARELALHGTAIVLVANESPSLNDMTADETVDVVEHLATLDPDLSALINAGMFEVVSSGNDISVIDLRDVSDELNEAAGDADLVVLEGMGRAVETNLGGEFKVDSLKLALLKSPHVAAWLGGEVFDCVCKYTPVGAES